MDYKTKIDSTYGVNGVGFFKQYNTDVICKYKSASEFIDEYIRRTAGGISDNLVKFNLPYLPDIKNVIFNKPATIVFWEDGSKTVVKCEKEKYDPEKGLVMAIAKKALGNKGNYYEVIKKWVGEERLFGNKKVEESEKKTAKKVEKKNKK